VGLLEVQDLRAAYGNVEVLKGISLSVGEGEIVALLGANGAGKTTTLRTLSGLVRARSGRVTLAGEDITRARAHPACSSGAASWRAPSPAASSRCWPSDAR
jgi:branched-chain amino acid transport system ATP-binding protein